MPWNAFNADHIASVGGGLEPQKKNNFVVILPVGGNLIRKALSRFPVPTDSNEVLTISYGNEERKVAGAARFTNAVLELYDFIDSDVLQQIMNWRDSYVHNPRTGQIGHAGDYKVQGVARMLGPGGQISREWRLIGLWPSEVNPGSGDMSANVTNVIAITLRVDKVIENNY